VWVKSKSHCYFPSSFSLTSFWAVISRSGVSFFSFVLAKFWRGRPEHPKSSIDKVLATESILRIPKRNQGKSLRFAEFCPLYIYERHQDNRVLGVWQVHPQQGRPRYPHWASPLLPSLLVSPSLEPKRNPRNLFVSRI
jgi:hypothetical protein